MTAPLLWIAAGGTGGHMFPAQALAEAMLSEGWRVKLSTDPRGARYSGSFPDAVTRQVTDSATFARGGLLAKVAVPLRLATGVLSALIKMLRDRPAIVVGFGGYPAIPAMAAAYLLQRPRMLHEQNGVMGRVNRLFARRVNRVACAVWPTDVPVGSKSVHTGNPVRASIRSQAGANYRAPDESGPLCVLVIGGSQGASILSRVVPSAFAALPDDLRARLRVAHQARDADRDQVMATYKAAKIEADVRAFFDDVPARLEAAQLVVSRSGASSVADIAAVGRPAIFVPLAAAIRDEQTANAKPLVEAGAAIVLAESDFTADALSVEAAAILGDPNKAARMAEAARRLGRPDAVDRLKHHVMEVAGHS